MSVSSARLILLRWCLTLVFLGCSALLLIANAIWGYIAGRASRQGRPAPSPVLVVGPAFAAGAGAFLPWPGIDPVSRVLVVGVTALAWEAITLAVARLIGQSRPSGTPDPSSTTDPTAGRAARQPLTPPAVARSTVRHAPRPPQYPHDKLRMEPQDRIPRPSERPFARRLRRRASCMIARD
jgi:hypothetical protein